MVAKPKNKWSHQPLSVCKVCNRTRLRRDICGVMQVVLITPPTTLAGEIHHVNRMFEAGLQVLHLRKPDAEMKDIRQYLQCIQPEYRNRVVLHEQHQLARDWGLKGIHFKERNRPPAPIPRLDVGLSQSTSLHSISDIAEDWQNFDYAFLSPIFDSISKEGYDSANFAPSQLLPAVQAAPMPIYALGGVTVDKLPSVCELGFKGVGLLGAVWNSQDPLAALCEFQVAIDNLQGQHRPGGSL